MKKTLFIIMVLVLVWASITLAEDWKILETRPSHESSRATSERWARDLDNQTQRMENNYLEDRARQLEIERDYYRWHPPKDDYTNPYQWDD